MSKLSDAKNHISVKVEMGEMDLTAAESKATYQEIQDWVQEEKTTAPELELPYDGAKTMLLADSLEFEGEM